MTITTRAKFFTALCASLVLAACANQMEPAQKLLGEVESAVAAAGADAQTYAPDASKAVTDKLAELKAAFDKKDYKTVVMNAPAVLTEAKALAATAATKKAEALAALNAQWSALSASLPQAVSAIESRLTMLNKSRKLPAGLTKDALTAANAGLAEVKTAWGEATAAFGAGNVQDALAKASAVKSKADGLLTTLGLAPAAAPEAAAAPAAPAAG